VRRNLDQTSRNAGHRTAPIMIAMEIIFETFLPLDGPDASLLAALPWGA
jgi:hypothetical protein